jgi:hypothetical protein
MNRRGTSGQGRWLGRLTARLAGLAVVLTAAACSQGAATAVHTASTAKLTVTSTLDRLTVLPHRIHWQAFPIAPAADVSEVDYLIDGKQLWTEHNAPYFYGSDGNYLVTSFLMPGKHTFTVRAITTGGQTATDTVTATVAAAPRPPASLAGTWKIFVKQNSPDAPPSGDWRLVISPVGWQVYDTSGGGGLYDVAYLAPGLAEIRTGMATGHHSTDLNAWCNNEPGTPARVRWTVTGGNLQFTYPASDPHTCTGIAADGFVTFLAHHNRTHPGTWTRVAP